MPASISQHSREYVYVPVQPESEDLAAVTTLPVFFAFLDDDAEPDPAEGAIWHEGSWAPEATVQRLHETYVARCLVGSGGTAVDLAVGSWNVWLRIDGAVERPVRPVGVLTIE